MIEVTGLPILLPPAITIPIDPSILVPPTQSTSALLPLFPPKSDSIASDLKLNLLTLHAKMVKAEFIGCILCGEINSVRLSG